MCWTNKLRHQCRRPRRRKREEQEQQPLSAHDFDYRLLPNLRHDHSKHNRRLLECCRQECEEHITLSDWQEPGVTYGEILQLDRALKAKRNFKLLSV